MDQQELESLAHRTCFRYAHSVNEDFRQYTFSKLTLRQFAAEIERQALERAAQTCDEVSIDLWNIYIGRALYSSSEEGRASDYVQGESDGAEKCADALRALMEPKT